MKTFVTFGQDHAHAVAGKTFDKNCVAVIHHTKPEEGRKLAFAYFDKKFCFEYPEDRWNEESMKYYPRGYIEVNPPLHKDDEKQLGILTSRNNRR